MAQRQRLSSFAVKLFSGNSIDAVFCRHLWLFSSMFCVFMTFCCDLRMMSVQEHVLSSAYVYQLNTSLTFFIGY